MEKIEEKEIYEIDGKRYIVVTRTVENAMSMNNLYESFSRYAMRKLNMKVG